MASMPEGMRKDGEWLILPLGPDVCKDIGGKPVPFGTIGKAEDSTDTSCRVRFTAFQAYNFSSYNFTCYNNELGVTGGEKSGVNRGVCYPLTKSETVITSGHGAVRDGDLAGINAPSKKGIFNTIGVFVWKKASQSAKMAIYLKLQRIVSAMEAWDKVAHKFDEAVGVPVFTHGMDYDSLGDALMDMPRGFSEELQSTFSDPVTASAAVLGNSGGIASQGVGATASIGSEVYGEVKTGTFAKDFENNRPGRFVGRVAAKVVLAVAIDRMLRMLRGVRISSRGAKSPSSTPKLKDYANWGSE